LLNLQQSLDKNKSPENISKALQTTMKVLSKQAESSRQLALILLVYTHSDSFDVDIAKMLNKIGKGHEALKAKMENKFGNLDDLNSNKN